MDGGGGGGGNLCSYVYRCVYFRLPGNAWCLKTRTSASLKWMRVGGGGGNLCSYIWMCV